LADGIILDLSSKSEKRINESIFSKAQQRQIPPDYRRAARSVRGGYIEAYFCTSRRLFVLRLPGGTDRIFSFASQSMKAKYCARSEWQNPDFIAKGGEQTTPPLAEALIKSATSWTIKTGKRGVRLRLAQRA
jgi:hypothetical protein